MPCAIKKRRNRMTDGWSKYTLTAARSHAPMSRPHERND